MVPDPHEEWYNEWFFAASRVIGGSEKNEETTYQNYEIACPGCKWTFEQLEAHFVAGRLDDKLLWSRIINLVNATLLNLILTVPRNPGVSGQQNYFELFGFDVIIDEKMRPDANQVNCSPALQVDCPVDESVKRPLVEDLLDAIYHPNVHDLVFPPPVRSSCAEPSSACPRTIGQFSLIFPFNAEVEALALQGTPIASGEQPGGKASPSQADVVMRSIVSHLRRVDKNIRQYAAESQRYRQDDQRDMLNAFFSPVWLVHAAWADQAHGTANPLQTSPDRSIFSVELYLHFASLEQSDQPLSLRTGGNVCRRKSTKNDVSPWFARMRNAVDAHGKASH
ncbi:Tubulin tyrosine ligase-like, member [Perkinsus olseni]|uniref:Tubulin tyrosine ligase-like, member n=1 Tax=Perkinsus olseni TaxID=32597 RepID=A0A7J6N7L9_PEROL|nr:Tubulin tyrosine ligase-like, member [Perkinsus olseni]